MGWDAWGGGGVARGARLIAVIARNRRHRPTSESQSFTAEARRRGEQPRSEVEKPPKAAAPHDLSKGRTGYRAGTEPAFPLDHPLSLRLQYPRPHPNV